MNAKNMNYIWSQYLGIYQLNEKQPIPQDKEFLGSQTKQKDFLNKIITAFHNNLEKEMEEKVNFCKTNKLSVFLPVVSI